jgi:hypothetical protein
MLCLRESFGVPLSNRLAREGLIVDRETVNSSSEQVEKLRQ